MEVVFSNILLNQYHAKKMLFSKNPGVNNTNRFKLKEMSTVWFKGVNGDPGKLFSNGKKPDGRTTYWKLGGAYEGMLDLLILTTWGEVFPSRYATFAVLGNNEPFGFAFSRRLSVLVYRNYIYFNDFTSSEILNNIRIWPPRLFAPANALENLGDRGIYKYKNQINTYWRYFNQNWYQDATSDVVTVSSDTIEETDARSYYSKSSKKLFFESIPNAGVAH